MNNPPTTWVPTGIVLETNPHWVAQVATVTTIPPRALSAYAGAALTVSQEQGCQVGWNTLAGIGWVESQHGTIAGGEIGLDGVARPAIIGVALQGQGTAAIPDTDEGMLDGDATWDRAVGPMQFIPQTWEQWGSDGDGNGVADPHSIDDAALTAARYLCHAHGSLSGQSQWIDAVRSYNNSADYQSQVAAAAGRYEADASLVE